MRSAKTLRVPGIARWRLNLRPHSLQAAAFDFGTSCAALCFDSASVRLTLFADSSLVGVTINTDWAQHPPKQLWKHLIGPGWGSFAVVGDCIYTQEQRGNQEAVVCYRAETGEELWSAKLPWGGYAPPTVYEIAGREYIVVAATGGGKVGTPTGDAYVAFALPERPNH